MKVQVGKSFYETEDRTSSARSCCFSRQRAVHTAVLLAVAEGSKSRMGRVFVRYVEAETVHCCAQCGTHLAAHEKIVSKAFQGRLLISGESLR